LENRLAGQLPYDRDYTVGAHIKEDMETTITFASLENAASLSFPTKQERLFQNRLPKPRLSSGRTQSNSKSNFFIKKAMKI
jgi:hypothetical protein